MFIVVEFQQESNYMYNLLAENLAQWGDFDMSVWYICTTKLKCGGPSLPNHSAGPTLLQRNIQSCYHCRQWVGSILWDPFYGIQSTGLRWFVWGFLYMCDEYIILLVLQMYSVHSTVQRDLATIIGMNQVQQWILGMRYRNMSNYKHKASINSSITVPLNWKSIKDGRWTVS